MKESMHSGEFAVAGHQYPEQKKFWLDKFSGQLEIDHFPFDFKADDGAEVSNQCINIQFSKILGEKLMTLSRSSDYSLYIILVAGLVVLLNKYTNSEDILVGAPIYKQDIEGDLINTILVLRIQLDPGMTFKQLLLQVREVLFEATENYNYPLELLPEILEMPVSGKSFPLFDILILLDNIHDRQYIRHIQTKMKFFFTRVGADVKAEVAYNTMLYEDATVQRLMDHLGNLLNHVLPTPDMIIAEIDILSHFEKEQLLFSFNDTATCYPKDKTIPLLLEEQVRKYPDRTAVVSSDGHLSYGEFNKKVNRLAAMLRKHGVTVDTIVGILLERSFEMIMAIFGVLKSGGTFLPIDPEFPIERFRDMLEDCRAPILLTQPDMVYDDFSWQSKSEIILVNQLEELIDKESEIDPEPINQPGNIAYTMFTSGSTGKPKGILTRHDNIIRVIRDTNYIDLTQDDRILQLSNYAFDGSTFDIYGALLNGSTLVMLKQQDISHADNLTRLIRMQAITVFFVTTALFNALVDMKIDCLAGVRKILFGGEKISIPHTRKALTYLGENKLIHVYGPTETTVFATYYFIDKIHPNRDTIPIGRPLANTRVYVLDKKRNLLPIGVAGEAYIGGDGLAAGYLNNKNLTSEKFIADPFLKGEYVYKSGDMVRWLADGNLEFSCRVDDQVKLRGFRIELGEIENQLLMHQDIAEARVIVNQDAHRDKYLCAYFVARAELAIPALREHLSNYLPDYMIPAYFMQIERIPLTRNGKLDHDALPLCGIEAGNEYRAPRNRIEKKLVVIWAEVLNVDINSIGIDSNFFELGGHSLNATILTSLIHKELNVKVPLAELFRIQTLTGLAEYIAQAGETKYAGIKPVELREYYPLSSAQKRLYFLQQLDLESTGYNIPLVFPLGEKIDKIKLESVLKGLIARHDGLRTSFEKVNGVTVQRVHDRETVDFFFDYYEAGLTEAAEIAKKYIQPFDLSHAPLIRCGLIKLPDNNHIWLVDIHHIVSDGTSQVILVEDFMALYNGLPMEPLQLQYKDFSRWQNHLFESGEIKAQEDYWLRLYTSAGEIPQLDLPADYKRPEVFTFAGDTHGFTWEREEVLEFEALNARHDGTLYMNILAALNTLFHLYTGQTDIIIGTGIAGRPHADLQKTMGMFVNTLAIRNYPQREKTYEFFLKEVILHSLRAFENQDLQFEELVDKLELERDASRNPLFDIMMVVQNFRYVREDAAKEENAWLWDLLSAPDENLPSIEYKNITSKFDMTFYVYELEEEVYIYIEYYTAIFKKETIARIARHFRKVVREVLNNPAVRLGDIEILTEQEKQQILYHFNDTGTGYPRDRTLPELFEEQVEKVPDHIAVVFGEAAITYKVLDEQANRVANYLCRENGVVPDQAVGLLMDRSLDMMVAIFGILKAGGAYVPISRSFPDERIKVMMNDADIRVFVGQKRFIKTLNRMQWECRNLDTILCIDSEDFYSEDEQETNELMNRKLWEYVAEKAVDDVTGGGWNSSYTGSPIPKEEMDEYGDNILKKLEPLLHKDMRVLEIGAASGISMYRIAPKVGFYYGTDLSGGIIEKNKERIEQEGHRNIKLWRGAAHEIQQLDEKDFDLVIINSVIQCFNGHNYLRKVFRKAIDLMRPDAKGYIFVGDIMDQDLKENLIADLAAFKQADTDRKYKTKTDWSDELFISRFFLEDLVLDYPEICHVEFSDKIYTLENELTKFRYDSLIHVDKGEGEKKIGKKSHKRQHDLSMLRKQSSGKFPVRLESDNLAYIIYTSGSTGKPKGNLTTHYNVTRVVRDTNYIEFQPGDRVLQLSDYAFDGSVFDIYGALLNGIPLVMISREDLLEIGTLCSLLKKERIGVFFLTTALFNTLVDVGLDSLANIRKILFGGERVSVKHVAAALEYLGKDRILHVYGPTETTVYATYYPINEVSGNQVTIPIGAPLANTTVYILGPGFKPVPIGVNGEIYIGGPGVCKGYLNNEALTQEMFLPNPFVEGDIIYKTGDLGRWLEDGWIEFIGRSDQQVKIRGFRIELGEIESRLLDYSTIKEALVTVKEEGNSSKSLCAYIVCTDETGYGKTADTAELREHLALTLPDYMIPTYYVQLDKMPLNPNGKIDLKALPDPEPGLTGEGYLAPGNEVQKMLVEAWQDVLGVARIGITDNFFEVGGDSIKAIQVSTRLKKYGLELKISNLFLYPTINGLSLYVTKAERVIDQGIVSGPVELTPIQHWFFQSGFTDNHFYNQSVMVCPHEKERFDEETLKKVFTKLVQHHDALRMIYEVRENSIAQVNRGIEGNLFDFEVFDFRAADDIDMSLEERVREEADRIQASIDLEKGPLLKTGLFKTADRDHLLIAVHHLVVDGISWRILLEDLGTGCRQVERGEEIKFRDKTDSFLYWSGQLNQHARDSKLLKESEYWKQVEDTEIQGISKDHEIGREEKKIKNTREITMNLDKENTDLLLKKVNHAYNTEINDILLTALALAFKDWQGLERTLINLEGHGREEIVEGVDISRTVGWFTSQFPVVLTVGKSKQLSYNIKAVKETLRQIPQKGIGYGILRYLTPREMKKGKWSHSEPEISFNYLGQFGQESSASFFNVSPFKPGKMISPEIKGTYAIEVNGLMAAGKLNLSLTYNPFQFDEINIQTLVSRFEANLIQVIDHCSHKEGQECTPSDVGCKDLSIEHLELINRHVTRDIDPNAQIDRIYPLTPMQAGMLYHALDDTIADAYFEQGVLTLKGEIEPRLLEHSFNILIDRHDIFRTIFFYEGLDQSLQVVLKERTAKMDYADIHHLDSDEQERHLREYQGNTRNIGFDLTRDIPTAISLFKTGESTWKLVWRFHHILMDGWCLGIIFKELVQAYGLLKQDKHVHLEPVTPYREYIDWLGNQDKEEGLRYWKEYLDGYNQTVSLVERNHAAGEEGYRLDIYSFDLDEKLTSDVNKIAMMNQVTVNSLFQTLWAILLQKYTDTDDVVFGVVVSGRVPEINGIENIVGLFINTLPIRIKIQKDQSFSQLARDVQKKEIVSKSYEYVPLPEIQANCPLKGNLFNHIMAFENYPLQEITNEMEGKKKIGFSLEKLAFREQANYDLNIIIGPDKCITIKFNYNSFKYDRDFIKTLAAHFRETLRKVILEPGISIAGIEMLTEEEKVEILSASVSIGEDEEYDF